MSLAKDVLVVLACILSSATAFSHGGIGGDNYYYEGSSFNGAPTLYSPKDKIRIDKIDLQSDGLSLTAYQKLENQAPNGNVVITLSYDSGDVITLEDALEINYKGFQYIQFPFIMSQDRSTIFYSSDIKPGVGLNVIIEERKRNTESPEIVVTTIQPTDYVTYLGEYGQYHRPQRTITKEHKCSGDFILVELPSLDLSTPLTQSQKSAISIKNK